MTDHTPSGRQAVELKPCPFCGGSALIIRCPPERDGQKTLHRPQCDQCGADCGGCDTPSEAIALWNRRTTAPSTAAADTARLDFLDQCNTRLNAYSGTNYQWKLILNHNVSRLMLGNLEVDLNDAEARGLPSCRDAIDAKMRECGTPVLASAPSTKGKDGFVAGLIKAREIVIEEGEPVAAEEAIGALIDSVYGGAYAPSTAAGEPALVCGCGWEGSYADLNETAEGMTCPKCRLSRNMDCAATPPAQGVEEENETLENLIDAAIGARTAPPWEEQAAQIRRQALEEAAKICDEMYVTFSSSMSPDRKNNKAWAMAANALADKIRALASSEKGRGDEGYN